MENEEPRPFEQGPIRPPSEAGSLLLRVTRNCQWNRCRFCTLYKGQDFSVRPVSEVVEDIDAVARHVETLRQRQEAGGMLHPAQLRQWHEGLPLAEKAPFRAAAHWLLNGLQSVFLQDADALAAGYGVLKSVLEHLRRVFPQVARVTCYSRSATIVGYTPKELENLRWAGLDRLHLGLESGSDQVLRMVRKGASRALHIRAGRMTREAGMELSVYVMPGLGGRALSGIHARETASALNQIDPHFIRLRTLAVPPGSPLEEDLRAGRFEPCNSLQIAEELLSLIESLEGIGSYVASDHALNLFEDLEGKLPGDKHRMVDLLRVFAALNEERRTLYLLGRRAGFFRGLNDMREPSRLAAAEQLGQQLGATPENVEEICAELMKRFI
ncbi:MAG: radical SAM protein [Syntrophotaleaceae bacterium]